MGVEVFSCRNHRQRENSMLLTIAAILFILWILGFSFHVGGSIIHALLVIALIVGIFHLITGRRVVD
jgi:predicted membrane protein